MIFRNLTPHVLNVVTAHSTASASTDVFEADGLVARVDCTYSPAGFLGKIPLYRAVYGDVTGLPAFEAGVTFVVSGMVAARCPRADVMSPGKLLRVLEGPDKGKIIGCDGLKLSL